MELGLHVRASMSELNKSFHDHACLTRDSLKLYDAGSTWKHEVVMLASKNILSKCIKEM